MTINFTHHLPNDFHPDSRVWIYQSDRMFSEKETEAIDEMLRQFTNSWTSHGAKVKGFGKVFFNRFIVLMADETSSGVSGCSTDSSVRLIKQIETQLGTSLFNRQHLIFLKESEMISIPLSQLNQAFQEGLIRPETPFFNNVVLSKKELEEKWIVSLKNSWLQNKVQ